MSSFFDYKQVYPELEHLKININDIISELEQYNSNWYNWPEKDLYLGLTDWKIIPMYGFNVWVDSVVPHFPKTIQMLKQIKGLRTAIFSALGPKTILKPHYGWPILANDVLRCHLGLIVPENCGIWVENEKHEQKYGEWLVFDDSKLHSGFNMSEQKRIVLLLDIERPINVPKGQSKGHETNELGEFIEYFLNKQKK